MATSADVRDAAAALVDAKAAEATAQANFNDKFAEALALIPDEQAAFDVAANVYNNAIESAKASLNFQDYVDALNSASTIRELAQQQLAATIADYDGT